MLLGLLKTLGVYKAYEKYLSSEIAKGVSPKHVGIILDGNRRWARLRSIPTWLGHWYGAQLADDVLEWCRELRIRAITLFVLSTENMSRPPEEVQELFRVITDKLNELLTDPRIHAYKVKVKGIGNLVVLPNELQDLLAKIEEATKDYGGLYLNIALAYGGRSEIIDVVRKLAVRAKKGEISPESISEDTIAQNLYTSYLPYPEPDLIIRTSGEERLSGFLLWQSAYSELVFLDVYWPDFRKIDLMRAIRTYQKRARRFGR